MIHHVAHNKMAASLLEVNSVMSGLLASLASVFSKVALEEGKMTLKWLVCFSNEACSEVREIFFK